MTDNSLAHVAARVQKNSIDRVIITGKSCSGKSTYSKELADKLGCQLVELDKVIEGLIPAHLINTKSGSKYFRDAYQMSPDENEFTRLFLENLTTFNGKVIFEGSIHNHEVISKIGGDSYLVLLMIPSIKEFFIRIRKRFIEAKGTRDSRLPERFWTTAPNISIWLYKLTGHITKALHLHINKIAIENYRKTMERQKYFERCGIKFMSIKT